MKRLVTGLITIIILTLVACDVPLGMGDSIDLEPAIIRVTHIEYPDGSIKEFETDDNGRLFLGPGILFGSGAKLRGIARDNIGIAEIRVRDVKTGNTIRSTDITGEDIEGWQHWSIMLDGLERGERQLEVAAYDRASLAGQLNIGPDTIMQLVLVIDTNQPAVRVYIERHPSVFANLLPASNLNGFNLGNFGEIDYFQNEKFTVRAEITHDFALADETGGIRDAVILNIFDSNGNSLLPAGKQYRHASSNNVYAPYWEITASDLTSSRPELASGRHNLRVQVTARAKAGHTGQNSTSNNILCWYPESDSPHINLAEPAGDVIFKNANALVPVQIFDDDDINEVYYAMITETRWEGFTAGGTTDEQKINYLCQGTNRNYFNQASERLDLNRFPASSNRRRNNIVQPNVGSTSGDYRLVVLARDRNANNSNNTMAGKVFKVNVINTSIPPCDLVDIICDNPDGIYNSGALTFKLMFSNEVQGSAALQFAGGAGGNTGGTRTVTLNPDTSDYNVMIGNWPIVSGSHYDPVTITSVNISGVTRRDGHGAVTTGTTDLINKFNSQRTGLKVMSIQPAVTQINGSAITNNTQAAAPVLANTNNSLTITFNTPVWPENGTITIRTPSDSGYLVPPVLETTDYARIISAPAITGAHVTSLFGPIGAYTRTTQGLKPEVRSGTTYYVPDTATKYVLNFTQSLDNASVRSILNTAKFNWREIDVHSTTGAGTSTITITLPSPSLPDGQYWEIEIPAGAFRDAAGNQSAAFGTGTDTERRTFWSATTATPVIRVERVSNNNATAAPTVITSSNVSAITASTSRTNVRYRIDCVTPGAVITYGTLTNKIAEITNNMTDTSVYRPRSTAQGQVSEMADATNAEMTGISASAPYAANSYLFIGDGSLYTARKDYIAAAATHSRLTNSARGYEGAFKTVVVFRNFVTARTTWGNAINMNTSTTHFMKLEASNVREGAVTIAGFPMVYNDMSGKGSKYFYRNRPYTIVPAVTGNTDWVWISWEIVSPMWFVPMIVNSSNVDSPLPGNGGANPPDSNGNNAWQYTDEDWVHYSYAHYGNWCLRVSHLGSF